MGVKGKSEGKQPVRERGPQSCNHKELDSANSPNEPQSIFPPTRPRASC